MQVIHTPWPWYGGRVAPELIEPEGKTTTHVVILSIILYKSLSLFSLAESFIHPNQTVNWWFGDPLELDESYPAALARGREDEPPPYTEVAQNGHVSLMHGHSPIKPTVAPGGEDADSSTLTANNISILEMSHNSQDRHDRSGSSDENALPDSSENSQSQNPFHPTRQSTPTLERRQVQQLPPLHRSRSVDTPSGIPLPLTSTITGQRHSLPSVPLLLQPRFSPSRFISESAFYSQGQLEDSNVQPDEIPISVQNAGPFPIRPGQLPPLQPTQQRRTSTGSDDQNQPHRRKKKKRKRTNSWHGERTGTEMNQAIQEVSTLSAVAE